MGFEVIQPGFAKLLGHATNASNKSPKLVPAFVCGFLKGKYINTVKDADDFNAFVEHFEMIVAYYPRKD